MLNLEKYQEFVVFSEYMNIMKAAEALYTSQSSLSKRLSQMEKDLGFDLITKRGNRLSLTDAGAHFLSGIQTILEDYSSLIKECEKIETNGPPKLTVLDINWVDMAETRLYNLINKLRRIYQNTQIHFVHINFQDLHTALLTGSIDIILEYHCAPSSQVLKTYEENGLFAVQISDEPLVVWGKRFLFEGRDTVDAEDLRDLSILIPNDASYPLKNISNEINEFFGYYPKRFISTAGSPKQFYYNSRKKSVYLLQESYVKTELFALRNDMQAVHFANDSIRCKAFVVIKRSGEHFEKLKALLEEFSVN